MARRSATRWNCRKCGKRIKEFNVGQEGMELWWQGMSIHDFMMNCLMSKQYKHVHWLIFSVYTLKGCLFRLMWLQMHRQKNLLCALPAVRERGEWMKSFVEVDRTWKDNPWDEQCCSSHVKPPRWFWKVQRGHILNSVCSQSAVVFFACFNGCLPWKCSKGSNKLRQTNCFHLLNSRLE